MQTSYKSSKRETYFWSEITDGEHFDVHGQLYFCRFLRTWCLSSVLLACLHLLILESGHGQQILEKEVQQDEGIELQVAILSLLKRFLCNLNYNLGDE